MKATIYGIIAAIVICSSLFYFQFWKSNLKNLSENVEKRLGDLTKAREQFESQYRYKLDALETVQHNVDSTLTKCFTVFSKAVQFLQMMGDKPEITDASPEPKTTKQSEQATGWTPELKEREQRVKDELKAIESDPKLAELYKYYKKNENRFENWNLAKFIDDPRINPNKVSLTPQEMMKLELAYTRSVFRIKSIDTEKELALQRAVSDKLNERAEYIERGEPPPKPNERFIDAVAVVQHNNIEVMIPRDEHPEIGVLNDERDPEIGRWLKEVCGFFAGK